MFEEWSKWYQLLSTSKSFKRAKLLALVLGLELAGLGYASLAGHPLEWLTILFVPIWLTFVSFREQLSLAYLVANERRKLARLAEFNEQTMLTEDEENQETDEEEEEVLEYVEDGKRVRQVLNETDKLLLCQCYVFLYLLFKLRVVGEKTHHQLVEMPVRKYREWLERLSLPELGLLSTGQGKTEVAPLSFEQALERIAAYEQVSNLWAFPQRVYANPRNWREYDPRAVEMEPGRKALVNNHQTRQQTPSPLPLYPTHLQQLQL